MSIVKYQSLTQSDDTKKRKEGWKKILNEIVAFNEHQSCEAAKLIKKSGYLINERRDNTKDLEKILNICDEKFKEDLSWKKIKSSLSREADIFNTLYTNVRIDLDKINTKIPQTLRTYMYLLTTEIMIRHIMVKAQYEIKKNKNCNKAMELEDEINRIVETTGTILNYIRRTEEISAVSPQNIHVDNLNDLMYESSQYLELANIWNGLKEICDLWTVSNLEISIEDKKDIFFNSKVPSAKERTVASISYGDISTAKQYKFSLIQMFRSKLTPFSDIRIKERLIQLEEINLDFINDVLFMGEESQIRNSVSIKNILKAYSILIAISERKLKKQSNIIFLKSLSQVAFIKRKIFWYKLFKKAGIEENVIDDIFELLVYSKKSRDLLDCPLYQFGDYFILLPSVVTKLNPAKSLLSNLNSKSIDVDFKGSVFENHLIEIIKKTNCKYATFSKKINGETYQCDLIFEIDGDVVLVEAKNLSPITSFRDFDKNDELLYEASIQLNRISDYLIQNEDIALMLGIKHVKSITKLVVSSIPVGKNKMYKGVYITDELCFSGYFLRRAPSLNYTNHSEEEYVVFKLYSQFYKGKICLKQFIELLEEDPYKKSLESKRIVESAYFIDKYQFTNECYEEGHKSVQICNGLNNDDIERYI